MYFNQANLPPLPNLTASLIKVTNSHSILSGPTPSPSFISQFTPVYSRSQWPRGLKRRSAVARLLRLWVRFPPMAWISVCCECSALSDRGLCDELMTRAEESYRLWCVVVCDLETFE